MAYAVLIGTAPGVYVSKRDADAACRGVKYFFVKRCPTVLDAHRELAAFLRTDAAETVVPVYTDGACSNNGKASARAGVGVFWGDDDPKNVSRPVRGAPTNNVAELEAVEDALDGIAGTRQHGLHFRILSGFRRERFQNLFCICGASQMDQCPRKANPSCKVCWILLQNSREDFCCFLMLAFSGGFFS